MRIVGNPAGQFGDLAMSTVLARAIKENWDDCKYTACFTKRYQAIAPLFLFHPDVDSIHFWDFEYEEYKNDNPMKYLQGINPDIFLSPFTPHQNDLWWRERHQCAEICNIFSINAPADLRVYFHKWFSSPRFDKKVALAPFGNWGAQNKSISLDRCEKLVEEINKLGYEVLQVGSINDAQIKGAEKLPLILFDSVRYVLGCRALISVDTGMNWIASGYRFPVLGLYSNEYFGEFLKNIQPINKNAIYLEDKSLNDIPIETVIDNLKTLL